MRLFVSVLEYSANIHLQYLLKEMVKYENIELCGIFDEKILDSINAKSSVDSTKSIETIDSAKNAKNTQNIESQNNANFAYFVSGKSLCDIENIAVMGFIDVLKKAKFFLELRKFCLNLALSSDKVLLMDSSSFNIPLAKRIKKHSPNKEIIYYILPQVWAWKSWRAKILEANCTKLAAILPFEVAFYKEKAIFVGHPLLDEIAYFKGDFPESHALEKNNKNSDVFAESNNLINSTNAKNAQSNTHTNSAYIFSFMPGSRMGEIERIFPVFIETKNELKKRYPNAIFYLIIPQKFQNKNLSQIYKNLDDWTISFDTHKSLFQSKFAFICSGTATLECALIGVPFVLGYKCRELEAFIARRFLKIKFIGLANLLYEKIKPNAIFHNELLQDDLNVRNLIESFEKADENDFLKKSLLLRKYLKNGSAKVVAKWLYDL